MGKVMAVKAVSPRNPRVDALGSPAPREKDSVEIMD
jgi:hypothetical protein